MVGLSTEASLPARVAEPWGWSPPAIAASSRGTFLAPGDGYEDLSPFILEGVEGEDMEAEEWHLKGKCALGQFLLCFGD
jgi:hypothetical protein